VDDLPRAVFEELALEFFRSNHLDKPGLEAWIRMRKEDLSDPWRFSTLREFFTHSKRALGIK